MKKIFNKFLVFFLAVSVFSCEDVDNTIYDVLDGVQRGAAIRTLEIVSANYNVFDPGSTFEIVVEEQDDEFGGLLQSINVYASYVDASDASNSVAEVQVQSIPVSEMTTSANGLPSTTVRYTLAEIAAVTGANYTGGSRFSYRLEAVLTDGRTFSEADVTGSLQGSFFSSPYVYNSSILCIPDNAIAGDYKIDMQDSYGDGWNGGAIEVNIDGVKSTVTISGAQGAANSETITVPAGTSTLEFVYISGDWDSEVSFQIYGPNSGRVIANATSGVAGPISLNLCFE
jgi:hypothetical protein